MYAGQAGNIGLAQEPIRVDDFLSAREICVQEEAAQQIEMSIILCNKFIVIPVQQGRRSNTVQSAHWPRLRPCICSATIARHLALAKVPSLWQVSHAHHKPGLAVPKVSKHLMSVCRFMCSHLSASAMELLVLRQLSRERADSLDDMLLRLRVHPAGPPLSWGISLLPSASSLHSHTSMHMSWDSVQIHSSQ